MYGDVVPVVDVGLRGFYKLQLLVGVVYECAEFALLGLAQGVAKQVVHLAAYVSRCVLQHVTERLVLAVYVGKEVLRAFRQVEYCL